MTIRTSLIGTFCAALLTTPLAANAQDVTLKLHHYLPAQANLPKLVMDVWADRIEEQSEGRIEIARYPSMQLGGTPPELMDQAVDGVADIIFTVVGYTPGRFPSTEVFELPFIMTDARAASYAYWTLFEEEMQDEFPGVEVLATWVHGPGVIHTSEPVETPDDLEGLKIRGGSRLVTKLLDQIGAESVGMSVTQIPEALAKGVLDGTTIPWEVTTALKIPELVEYHTEFEDAYLYTLTFALVMNADSYAALPDDLRAIIDANSGRSLSIFAGGTQADADGPARALAEEAGNEITRVASDKQAIWRDTVDPIHAEWVAEMADRGLDGQALIDRAKALMDAYDPVLDDFERN